MEGSGPGAGRPAELPAGVRLRHGWRPPMLRTLDRLLLGIEARARPLLGGIDRLVAWHEGLSRRAEPWSGGWQPLDLVRGADTPGLVQPQDGPSDDPSRRPATARTASPPDVVPARPTADEPRRVRPPGTGPTPMPGVARARLVRSATGSPYPIRGPDGQPVPYRPGVRLASLRPQSGPPSRPPGTPPGYGPVQPAAPNAAPSIGATSDRPSPASFGPLLSASPSPRREVRGGFPAPSTSAPALATPARPDPGTPPVAPSRRVPPASAAESPLPRAPVTPPPSRSPDRPLDGPGVIERLIESTVLPAPLPGLELRLVPPEERGTRDIGTAMLTQVEWSESAPAETAPAAPAPPNPPLDLNALADRVYQTLQRRQLLERERRGLY